jgi:hypothetical protein
MVAVPVITCAADPNAPPPDPNTPVAKRNVVAQTPVQAQPKPPARPAVQTPASFTPQMPLGEAIDILRNCTTPPLKIIVLWRSLDSAGIHRDTPIGLDGQPGLRVGQYLDLLVLSLSAGASDRIGYTVHGGVITIGVTTVLPAPRPETRIYDISDLTALPANYRLPPMGFGGMGYGGMYGNQMMGLTGGYGGGLGMGYGMGSPSMPGGSYGLNGAGGLPSLIGSTYGGTRTRSGVPRGR